MAANLPALAAAVTDIQGAGPLRKLIKALPDGVHETNEVGKLFNTHGKVPWDDGAEYVFWNIETVTRQATGYWKGSTLNTGTEELNKQLAIIRTTLNMNVTYHKTDLLQNQSSPQRMQNYVAGRVNNAAKGMSQTFDLQILGNGTANGNAVDYADIPFQDPTHVIQGLGLALEADSSPSNTYGGQTRSSSTKWLNNQELDITALGNLTTSFMHQLFARCSHMGMRPNWAITNDTAFRKMWNISKGETWFKGPSKAAVDLGFPESIDFHGMAIIPTKTMTSTDNGGILDTEINKIYFMNIGTGEDAGMQWLVDPSDDMVLGEVRMPIDQHTFVQHMTWNGALVMLNPRLNGVIYWT